MGTIARTEPIDKKIHFIRGKKVMLSHDPAAL